jgi:hypothetical protein
MKVILQMDADLKYAKAKITNYEFEAATLNEVLNDKDVIIRTMNEINLNDASVIMLKDKDIAELEDVNKSNTRKIKLFKATTVIGFALIPVTVVYMLINTTL